MGEGIVRELGMVRYTLLYLKWMTKKPRKPLNVMWQAGWEGSFRENGYVYICMVESLCCPPKTVTTLLTGPTPVENKKFN